MGMVGSTPSAPYRCEADRRLDHLPPVPAGDTAGLGARIKTTFPAYRLSTEREIACRFPLLDVSTPPRLPDRAG
jgi:hypothetical protein